jgi:hypothetical protein
MSPRRFLKTPVTILNSLYAADIPARKPLASKNPTTSDALRDDRVKFYYSMVNGKRAMFLARFIAVVSRRWCLAQQPEIRRGNIFPRSVI